jgi:hypothetical protein
MPLLVSKMHCCLFHSSVLTHVFAVQLSDLLCPQILMVMKLSSLVMMSW